ncbi:MFS transporter, DHA2 family, multidrug resistance protein [Enhydrobacter aerosaccus]|uniref:MFS transporter, DHA2 family, multidrug resistance protein n=1 Tax=Enhydrobacter aerosaccus TaxID=225324 RepID=A0A1T4JNR3_9HYPH|nr:MFS transporter [Enhydrobacter aerosaccus]SJZ31788.1 MFS transporter, DHA2 family, multidrug resistance protein [Enhydrobacter aerosaccus]
MSTAAVAAVPVEENEGLPPPRRYWVLACVLCGVALMSIDGAIANIALPTMARDLGASDAATVWVVNIYQLGSVVCLLPAAALGEILGLKRVYAFGLILFTLSSLACALSPTLPILILARFVQGAGCACIAAIGPAVVRDIYPRRLIGSGLAMIALCVAAGGALGPTIASLILSVATWPWLFLVNVPIGIVAVPLFLSLARPGRPYPRPFDYAAALLSAAALSLLLIGVDSLGSSERTLAIGEMAAGLACGAALVWHQSGRTNALLPLDLLRIPLMSLSLATSTCAYIAQILAYVSLPFLFETVMHRSQTETGFLVTPWPALIFFAAPLAGRLVRRYPAALLSSIGLAILATGLLLLATMPTQPSDLDIAWRMAICGIGFGFYQTPNNATVMTAGPVSRSGAAGGMLAVARTLGWCIGSALVTVIFSLSAQGATILCLEIACGFAIVGAIVSVARFSARR